MEMDDIKLNLKRKYTLDSNNIPIGSLTYFIFMEESRYLEKCIKKGKIINQNLTHYQIQSDELCRVPRFFTFLNKYRAQEILNKLSVDEIRFLM